MIQSVGVGVGVGNLTALTVGIVHEDTKHFDTRTEACDLTGAQAGPCAYCKQGRCSRINVIQDGSIEVRRWRLPLTAHCLVSLRSSIDFFIPSASRPSVGFVHASYPSIGSFGSCHWRWRRLGLSVSTG